MNQLKRLTDLIIEAEYRTLDIAIIKSRVQRIVEIADYMISHGVIFPPCKVGDTVWVLNQTRGCIYENKVTGIYITGTADYRNSIRLEYTNQHGEKSFRKFTFRQIGKNIFYTREEAETALKNLNPEKDCSS